MGSFRLLDVPTGKHSCEISYDQHELNYCDFDLVLDLSREPGCARN